MSNSASLCCSSLSCCSTTFKRNNIDTCISNFCTWKTFEINLKIHYLSHVFCISSGFLSSWSLNYFVLIFLLLQEWRWKKFSSPHARFIKWVLPSDFWSIKINYTNWNLFHKKSHFDKPKRCLPSWPMLLKSSNPAPAKTKGHIFELHTGSRNSCSCSHWKIHFRV